MTADQHDWLSLASALSLVTARTKILGQVDDIGEAKRLILSAMDSGDLGWSVITYERIDRVFSLIKNPPRLQPFHNGLWSQLDVDWARGIAEVRGDHVQRRRGHGIALDPADVDRIWPPSEGSVGSKVAARKMGAPMKHDWARAAGFLAAIIVADDPPETAAIKEVLKFFQERGREPDLRDVQRFVAHTFAEYALWRPKGQS